jgi:SAM-dependent methyltransferase
MPAIIGNEAFKRFESTSYSDVAQGYADKTAHVSAQSNDRILDIAEVTSGSAVSDVACGPGLLAAAAVQRGASVIGVDFAPNMVAIARVQCPDAEFQEADAESLPFEDARFDAVVCSLGILHFPKPETAVGEVFRVLKSGGRYVFTCWKPPAANPFMALILGSIQAHGTLSVDLPAGPPLFRFGEPAECDGILRQAGFVQRNVTECPLIWPAASPEEFLREIPKSAGRLGPLLALQAEDQRLAIETAILRAAQAFQTQDGVRIPSAVIIASGRKP